MLGTVSNPGSWLLDRATSIVSGVVCTLARRMKMRCGILRSMIRVSVRPCATRVVVFTYGFGLRFRFFLLAETVAGLAVVLLVVVERVAGASSAVGVDGIERTGVVLPVDGSHAGETSAHDVLVSCVMPDPSGAIVEMLRAPPPAGNPLNAILVPSGDQDGCAAFTPSGVTFVAAAPVAGMR